MFNEKRGEETGSLISQGSEEAAVTFMIDDNLARFQFYESLRRVTPWESVVTKGTQTRKQESGGGFSMTRKPG
jgi:hypothetical protein